MRRQRVVLRTKARSHRRKKVVAALGIVALAALGAAFLKNKGLNGRIPARLAPEMSLRRVEVLGLPRPLGERVSAAFNASVGKPMAGLDEAAARGQLKVRYPFLRLDRFRKDWIWRTVRLGVSIRKFLARCESGSRRGRFLGEDGEVFEAPARMAGPGLPEAISICSQASDEPRRQAAQFIARWQEAGSNSLPLHSVTPGPDGGWNLELAGGTRVRWGKSDSMGPQLEKLQKVLEDGRKRFSGILTADMRFFDQGKVIVEPVRK